MKKNPLFMLSIKLFTALTLLVLVNYQMFAQVHPDMNPLQKISKNFAPDLPPGTAVFFVDAINTNPILAATQTPGAWYPDRYPPRSFEKYVFGSENVLKHRIDVLDAALNRPSGQQGSFYNTQGRKYDISNGNNTAVIADLYIPASWQTAHRRADIWGTGFNISNTVSAYPIIGFANMTGSNPTFRVWNSNEPGGWINISMSITYDTWYTLKYELIGSTINYYINNTLVHTYEAPGTIYLGNIIVQAYNFGDPALPPEQYALESYDVYWDNVGAISKIKNISTNTYSATLQDAITSAVDGNTIQLEAGTFVEGNTTNPQIVINKNITITGVNKNTVIIKPGANTGTNADARGWFFVQPGKTFNLNNVTLDGIDKLISIGVLSKGPGTIDNNIFKNIGYNPSGPDYAGRGLAFYDYNMIVTNNTLSNIGRIGLYCYGTGVTNGIFTGNTYTGKGTGNWLDYAIEVEGGAHATITNNIMSNCLGVANDGSTSAGICATTWFALGTTINCYDNVFTNNTDGIGIGATTSDATTCIASNNTFNNNTWGINSLSTINVQATLNWWGNETGPTVASNPSGTGDAVTTNVNYNPWLGQSGVETITNADLNNPVVFPTANTTITFTTLPPNANGSLTIQRLATKPDGVKTPPSGASPVMGLYLTIGLTGIPNYEFNCEVVVDVNGINGFNPNTKVMYYSTTSLSWVMVNGIYDPVAKTYTFVTDHFSTWIFVNPTNPNNVYLSQVAATPETTTKWYPYEGMGTGPKFGAGDWSYTGATMEFYVVPTGTQGIMGTEFMLTWDKTMGDITSITEGNFWTGTRVYQAIDSSIGDQGRYWINIADLTNTNVTPGDGKYFAKGTMSLNKPGYMPVQIEGVNMRYYDGSWQQDVFATTYSGKMFLYLGDFASPTNNQNLGDGKITGEDLAPFGTAYWSVNTNPPSNVLYKSKFDIGPTLGPNMFPNPDNRIQFEDLMVFAIGYGKTASGQLPQLPVKNDVRVTALAPEHRSDGNIQIPVELSGSVIDVRGFSLELNHTEGLEYVGVERAGQMTEGLTFIAGKSSGNLINIDGAVISDNSINGNGIVANVVFRQKNAGNHKAIVSSAIVRNTGNQNYPIVLNGESLTEIPTVFDLKQNYPNPFNPVTLIKYQLPKASNVTLKVYDMTGRELATLINGVNKEPGYYQIEFNAKNYASGVYFYKIEAGDFVSTKKMILVK